MNQSGLWKTFQKVLTDFSFFIKRFFEDEKHKSLGSTRLCLGRFGGGEFIGEECLFHNDSRSLFSAELSSESLGYFSVPKSSVNILLDPKGAETALECFSERILHRLSFIKKRLLTENQDWAIQKGLFEKKRSSSIEFRPGQKEGIKKRGKPSKATIRLNKLLDTVDQEYKSRHELSDNLTEAKPTESASSRSLGGERLLEGIRRMMINMRVKAKQKSEKEVMESDKFDLQGFSKDKLLKELNREQIRLKFQNMRVKKSQGFSGKKKHINTSGSIKSRSEVDRTPEKFISLSSRSLTRRIFGTIQASPDIDITSTPQILIKSATSINKSSPKSSALPPPLPKLVPLPQRQSFLTAPHSRPFRTSPRQNYSLEVEDSGIKVVKAFDLGLDKDSSGKDCSKSIHSKATKFSSLSDRKLSSKKSPPKSFSRGRVSQISIKPKKTGSEKETSYFSSLVETQATPEPLVPAHLILAHKMKLMKAARRK